MNKTECMQMKFHDGYTLKGGDPAEGKLVFEGPGVDNIEVAADLVVGADGVASPVRELLQENVRTPPPFPV